VLGLIALRTGLAAIALLTVQNPCVALGESLFGPEFTKTFNEPTEAQRRRMEEEAAEAKKNREAIDAMIEALKPENIAKGPGMDLSKIDKAISLRPSDPLYYETKAAMLIAAGKPDEARAVSGQALSLIEKEEAAHRAFARQNNLPDISVDPKAKLIAGQAYELRLVVRAAPPGSPQQRNAQRELCNQVAYSRANYPPNSAYSMHNSYQDLCPP
jgi:hypothetical protein